MKLWHSFTNLYLLSSLNLLGLVVLDSPTIAAAELSEKAAPSRVLTTDTKLPKEISPTLWNAGDTLEKVEQSEPLRAEFKPCDTYRTNPSGIADRHSSGWTSMAGLSAFELSTENY